MRYTFKCSSCETSEVKNLPVSKCDSHPKCKCGARMSRDFMADWKTVQFDTSSCKDHSNVKETARVASAFDSGTPAQMEQKFKRHIEQRRQQITDAGGQRGTIRQTHAVPAHLYHGKIKESGDKDYWSDPKNLAKHGECKVN